jgi:hypothetical protein
VVYLLPDGLIVEFPLHIVGQGNLIHVSEIPFKILARRIKTVMRIEYIHGK